MMVGRGSAADSAVIDRATQDGEDGQHWWHFVEAALEFVG